MIDPAALAELAFAEVLAAGPRTPERRAAVALYVAATVPPTKSVQAIRTALTTFGTDAAQKAALELLGRLTQLAEQAEQESA